MPSRGQWCGRSCVVPLGTSTARLLWAGVSSQAPAGVPLWANTAGSFPLLPQCNQRQHSDFSLCFYGVFTKVFTDVVPSIKLIVVAPTFTSFTSAFACIKCPTGICRMSE